MILDHIEKGQLGHLELHQLKALYTPFDPLGPSSYIVMDFAPNLNLFNYISNQRLNIDASIYYFNQLVDGLYYIFKKK